MSALKLRVSAAPLSAADLPKLTKNPASASHDEYLVHVSVVPSVHPHSSDGVTLPAEQSQTLPTTPVDIIAVVDVSGSMGSEATLLTENGTTESGGLTILDVVKHAVRTIIHTLGPEDRLGVVAFSDGASVVVPLTLMTDAGKSEADDLLWSLREDSSTNLWAGLECATKLFSSLASEAPPRQSTRHIFLLTDGQPNSVPSTATMLSSLRSIRDSSPGGHFPADALTTFGFGYYLDSDLLLALAVHSGRPSMYSFIPDPGMVGTAFVNAVSSAVCKVPVRNVRVALEVEGPQGTQVHKAEGEDAATGAQTPIQIADWGCQIDVGTVAYGQPRDTVLRVQVPKPAAGTPPSAVKLHAVLKYDLLSKEQADINGTEISSTLALPPTSSTSPNPLLTHHHLRLLFSRTLFHALVNTPTNSLGSEEAPGPALLSAQAALGDYIALARGKFNEIQTAGRGTDPASDVVGDLKALLEDAEGQATMALSRASYYQKWGNHYLKSLARAHVLQECANFKDPGLQRYSKALQDASLFSRTRDAADAVFANLQITGTLVQYDDYGRGGGGGGGGQRVNMAAWNSSGNPCFPATTSILLADMTHAPVSSLRRGTLVVSPYMHPDGTAGLGTARVRTVLESRVVGGVCDLVGLVGKTGKGVVQVFGSAEEGDQVLQITPWHPVAHLGKSGPKWVFPAELQAARPMPVPSVCSIILEPVFTDLTISDGPTGHIVARPHAVLLSTSHIPVITLAHGLDDSARVVETAPGYPEHWKSLTRVVGHEVWGGDGVVEELKGREGWDEGWVRIGW
ncbi:hypothetical protein M427DRAFT_51930 [Gonapodya prolifera JEL478]|uniref:VWFA domain-containing protein n=1 Tax=Gonapodya prolifera (strain JEL478) TaxID=1344416 RepID=A0A139AW89_GONPJ|nr:hypothetical protein M427DRAFT_51930 [Gonapodya prolifera JEL478]|eukprot:KXS20977.1 hypothetical protein M427DRAFT_51930 [Gonapodya prolifera JEL478]